MLLLIERDFAGILVEQAAFQRVMARCVKPLLHLCAIRFPTLRSRHATT
jgi:hypothetical protein